MKTFVTSDGLSLAYADEGQGLPLLCLPGLTRNSEDFLPVVEHFAGRCRVIRLDLRGRGNSAHDPQYLNYNILQETRDALELMDHLGLAEAVVYGTSRGGLIAITMAVHAPERLRAAILNDIGPVVAPEGVVRILGYLGVTPPFPSLDAAAEAQAAAMAAQFRGVTPAAWRVYLGRVWREGPGGLELRYDANLRQATIEQANVTVDIDLWALFDKLAERPLLLIRGAESDILTAATAEEMRARAPGMAFVEVPDRGHTPFLDEPEVVAATAAFLDRLDAGGRAPA